jgi:glycosyltransferase involved in cell wall biosynthesis
MKKVSACLIVKNEEKVLGQCLESIKDIVDEIIITDTGSTDSTVEIAKEFTDKIYHFKWIDDFSAARNYCSQFACYEYILRFDADFVLRSSSLPSVLELKSRDFDNADIINVSWNVEFNEDHEPLKSLTTMMFYVKNKFHWESPIHNQLVANNLDEEMKINYYLDIEIDHYKDREEKAHRYKQTSEILKKVLEKDPENSRLILNYASELRFNKDYAGASDQYLKYLNLFDLKSNVEERFVVVVESLLYCYFKLKKINEAKTLVNTYFEKYKKYPRFILAYADATLPFDINGAKYFYHEYLKKPLKKNETLLSFDYERHVIHPFLMLGNIYMRENEKNYAEKFFRYIFDNTKLKKRKNHARLVLETLIK